MIRGPFAEFAPVGNESQTGKPASSPWRDWLTRISRGEAAASIADRFYLFDNSVDRQAPRRLFRAVDGSLAREYEAPPHEVAAMLRDAVVTAPR